MPIKAIGFDLFGTLVEAEAKVNDCIFSMCNHLHNLGYSFADDVFLQTYREVVREKRSTRYEEYKEVNNTVWVSDTLNNMGFDTDSEHSEISSTVEKYFEEWRIVLYQDVMSVLENLGYDFKIGLVSNFTNSAFLHKILIKFGLETLFDTITVSDSCGWRKPHPKIFSDFLKSLDAKPVETVFVGDDLINDVQGANRVGINTVLIDRSENKRREYEITPDYIVCSLTEFEKMVHSWM